MWRVIAKDIRLLLSDKKTLITLIIMPLVLSTILSFAFQGNTANDVISEPVKMAVVKAYDVEKERTDFASFFTELSGEELDVSDFDPEKIFFEDFLGNEDLKDIISVEVMTLKGAEMAIDANSISGYVVLEEGFIYNQYLNLFSPFRKNVVINVVENSERTFTASVVSGVIEGYFDTLRNRMASSKVLMSEVLKNEGDFEEISSYIDLVNVETNRSEVVFEDISVTGRPPISSFGYYTAAMMTMFMLYIAGFGGRSILDEKFNYTFQRLRMAGLKRSYMLVGKMGLVVFIVMLQMLVMISFSHFAFNVYWGGIVEIIALIATSCIMIAALSGIIAGISLRVGSMTFANLFENVVVYILALFGGSFIPIDVLPASFQYISQFIPNGLLLRIATMHMQGYTLADTYNYMLIVAGISIVAIVLSMLSMREEGKVYVNSTETENQTV